MHSREVVAHGVHQLLSLLHRSLLHVLHLLAFTRLKPSTRQRAVSLIVLQLTDSVGALLPDVL